jgi:NAD(P)H-dependent flavin oxidoreductase YrpB (nitropropane dioxygenase family)
MVRSPEPDWIKIRQRRVVDGIEYHADRLYKTQHAAKTYARQLEYRGAEVLVFGTATEGGHRGYAVFAKRE